jgi:hypothetical protein
MNTPLILLTLLTVARAARLVTVDYLTKPLRRWLAGTEEQYLDGELIDAGLGLDDRPMVGYLVTCPWCSSVWLSPPLVSVVVFWPDNRLVWVLVLAGAASYVAGLLAVVESALDGGGDDG